MRSPCAGQARPQSAVPRRMRKRPARLAPVDDTLCCTPPNEGTPAAPTTGVHRGSPTVRDELVLCLSGAGVSSFDVPAIIAVVHSDLEELRQWAGTPAGGMKDAGTGDYGHDVDRVGRSGVSTEVEDGCIAGNEPCTGQNTNIVGAATGKQTFEVGMGSLLLLRSAIVCSCVVSVRFIFFSVERSAGACRDSRESVLLRSFLRLLHIRLLNYCYSYTLRGLHLEAAHVGNSCMSNQLEWMCYSPISVGWQRMGFYAHSTVCTSYTPVLCGLSMYWYRISMLYSCSRMEHTTFCP